MFDGIIQDIGALEILISLMMAPPAKADSSSSSLASHKSSRRAEHVRVSPRFSRYNAHGSQANGYQMGFMASGRF